MSRHQATSARLTPEGDLYLPAELLKRHGLENGGDVLIEDTGDAIVLTAVAQATRQVQAPSRDIPQGRSNASIDDCRAGRRREAENE